MEQLMEKLKILADGAKYDVSCASSGSNRKNKGGLGSGVSCGICHTWTSNGRCVSLLKVLLSNRCMYNCAYCPNRSSADTPRAAFTPEELCRLTLAFYRRNYIEGLFLSSAVEKSADQTMARLVQVAEMLRAQNFNGYIHLKMIPGTSPELLEAAGRSADRLSINIELPSESSLKLLAPQKTKANILAPMAQASRHLLQLGEEKKLFKNAPVFAPAGQSTQMIVGASPESDRQILLLSEGLYHQYRLRRVYYSAYVPVGSHPTLPLTPPPLLREHRLYQSDWLMRFYGFSAAEILDEKSPQLDLRFDPKVGWALRHLDLFPMEVNKVPYDLLLRIPGVGLTGAARIMSARKMAGLSFEDLKRLGIVLKRAQYFLLCNGKRLSDVSHLTKGNTALLQLGDGGTSVFGGQEQMTLFDRGTVLLSNA